MISYKKVIIPRKSMLALCTASLFAAPAIAEIVHSDEDRERLEQATKNGTLLTLDSNDSQHLLDKDHNLKPSGMDNNVVYITGTGGTANSPFALYGGNCYNPKGDCETKNNAVIMNEGTVSGILVGTYSESANTVLAIGTISMYGGSVERGVYGASTHSSGNGTGISTATGTFNLYDGSVGGNIYAVLTSGSVASTVTGAVNMYDGSVDGDVYGTVSITLNSVSSKSIINLNGGTVSGSVVGAYISGSSDTANANSTITLDGEVKLQKADGTYASELWGVSWMENLPQTYNIFSGNILNMRAAPITVTKLGNFEHYNFALSDHNSIVINNTQTALITVTQELANNDTGYADGTKKVNQSRVQLTGISGERMLRRGDTINLIALKNGVSITQGQNATSLKDFFDLTNSSNTIDVGLVRTAQVSYHTTDNSVVATIESTSDSEVSPDRIKRNVTPLAEGRVATLQGVTRGADLLSQVLSAPTVASGTFTPIAVMDGGVNRYNSGSHTDSRETRVMAGSRWQVTDRVAAGLVMEYGYSSFDTHNRFSSGNVLGNGNVSHWGASIFGSYNLPVADDMAYTDISLRAGRSSTEYSTNDIVTGGGTAAAYKSRVNYIGGSLGVGYVYASTDRHKLDSSIRYYYTKLGSDSVVIDGDQVNFGTAVSSRVQLKEQLSYEASQQVTATMAGIYEYETNGRAGAYTYGMDTEAPSVKGATGIVELGLKTRPAVRIPSLGMDLSFRGYTGQRDGVSGAVRVSYDF
ncbi:autotransporter outer membrane beta-barrel domain-containing protein [Citrobacter werkmanii]